MVMMIKRILLFNLSKIKKTVYGSVIFVFLIAVSSLLIGISFSMEDSFSSLFKAVYKATNCADYSAIFPREYLEKKRGEIEALIKESEMNSAYEIEDALIFLKTAISVENEEELRQLCDFFITKESVSIDTETTSTDAISAELVGLSFSVEEKKAFYVSVPANYEEAIKIVQIFKPLYESDKIMKIGQNIKYDYEVLTRYGVTLQGKMFDTMIAHYLIQPELHHNMDYMAETLFGYQTIHIEELLGPKGKKQKNMRDLSPTDIYEYAAEDADITLRLKNVLEPRLKELGVEELFWKIEMPLAFRRSLTLSPASSYFQSLSFLHPACVQQMEDLLYSLISLRYSSLQM